MAFSIQQAMDEFFNNSGGGGIKYGGTGISGGYDSIAGGGSGKKAGGAGTGSADGGVGSSKGNGSGTVPSPEIKKNPLPFNPYEYRIHEKIDSGYFYFNKIYVSPEGKPTRCDGWFVTDGPPQEAQPLPKCPITVSSLSWHWF